MSTIFAVACIALWATFGLWAPFVGIPEGAWLPLAVVLLGVGVYTLASSLHRDSRR
jgi:hypothetical protein